MFSIQVMATFTYSQIGSDRDMGPSVAACISTEARCTGQLWQMSEETQGPRSHVSVYQNIPT